MKLIKLRNDKNVDVFINPSHIIYVESVSGDHWVVHLIDSQSVTITRESFDELFVKMNKIDGSQ